MRFAGAGPRQRLAFRRSRAASAAAVESWPPAGTAAPPSAASVLFIAVCPRIGIFDAAASAVHPLQVLLRIVSTIDDFGDFL